MDRMPNQFGVSSTLIDEDDLYRSVLIRNTIKEMDRPLPTASPEPNRSAQKQREVQENSTKRSNPMMVKRPK